MNTVKEFTNFLDNVVTEIKARNKIMDIEKEDPELFEAFKAFALKLNETVQMIDSTSP